jgi:hypothetical protein
VRLEGLKTPMTSMEIKPAVFSVHHSASTMILHTPWDSYIWIMKSGMLKIGMTKIQAFSSTWIHYLHYFNHPVGVRFLASLYICTNLFPYICNGWKKHCIKWYFRYTFFTHSVAHPLNSFSCSIQYFWDQQDRVPLLPTVSATSISLGTSEI